MILVEYIEKVKQFPYVIMLNFLLIAGLNRFTTKYIYMRFFNIINFHNNFNISVKIKRRNEDVKKVVVFLVAGSACF